MDEKLKINLLNSLEDKNYIVFDVQLDQAMRSVRPSFNYDIQLSFNLNQQDTNFFMEDKEKVENLFSAYENKFFVIDKENILSNIGRFIETSDRRVWLTIHVEYLRKFQKVITENKEKLLLVYLEQDEKRKIQLIDEFKTILVEEKVLSKSECELKLDINAITHLMLILEQICDVQVNYNHEKIKINTSKLSVRAADTYESINIDKKYLDFHIKKIVDIAREAKSNKAKMDLSLGYIKQKGELSFLEKYGPELIGEEKTDKHILTALNHSFVKSNVEFNPNYLLSLMDGFIQLKVFDKFLEAKLAKKLASQEMMLLKILDMDKERFTPLFEKYGFIKKNHITKKSYDMIEYNLDIINLIKDSINIKDYKQGIDKVGMLLKSLFKEHRVNLIHEENSMIFQIFYDSDNNEREYGKDKEIFVLDDLFKNSKEYLNKIEVKSSDIASAIEKVSREILLKFEMQKTDKNDNLKVRKKI